MDFSSDENFQFHSPSIASADDLNNTNSYSAATASTTSISASPNYYPSDSGQQQQHSNSNSSESNDGTSANGHRHTNSAAMSRLNLHYYGNSPNQQINVISPMSPNFSTSFYNTQISPNQQFQFVIQNQLPNQLSGSLSNHSSNQVGSSSQIPTQLTNQIPSQLSAQQPTQFQNHLPTQNLNISSNSIALDEINLHSPSQTRHQSPTSNSISSTNSSNPVTRFAHASSASLSSLQPIEPKKRKQSLSKKHKRDLSAQPAFNSSSSSTINIKNPNSSTLSDESNNGSNTSTKNYPKEKTDKPRISRDSPKEARLQEAMRLVQEGKYSRRKAAAQTGISPNTLKRRLNGSVSREEYLERTKKISALEEFVLECVLVALVSQGAIIKPAALRAIVALYLNHRNAVPGIVDENIIQQYTEEGQSSNRYYDTMVQNKNLLLQIEQLQDEIRKLKKDSSTKASPTKETTSAALEKSSSGSSDKCIEEFNSIPKGWCSRFLKRSKFLELVNGNVSAEDSVAKKFSLNSSQSLDKRRSRKLRQSNDANEGEDGYDGDSEEEEEYNPDETLDETTSLKLLPGYSIPCHPNDKEKFTKTYISTKNQPSSLQTFSYPSSAASSTTSLSLIKQESLEPIKLDDSLDNGQLLRLIDITLLPEFSQLEQCLSEYSSKNTSQYLLNDGNISASSSSNANCADPNGSETKPLSLVMQVIQCIIQGPLSETAKAEFCAQENKMKLIYNHTVSSVSSALASSYSLLQHIVTSNLSSSNTNKYKEVDIDMVDDIETSNVSHESSSTIIRLPVSIMDQPTHASDHLGTNLSSAQNRYGSTQSHNYQHLQQISGLHNAATASKRIVTPPDNIVSYLKNPNSVQFPVTPNTPKSGYLPTPKGSHNKLQSLSFSGGVAVAGSVSGNGSINSNTNGSNGAANSSTSSTTIMPSSSFHNLSTQYENVFKVNLRPQQQQQQQQLKMVIETGIKSPKKRKRGVHPKEESKKQKVDEDGQSFGIESRSGSGKGSNTNIQNIGNNQSQNNHTTQKAGPHKPERTRQKPDVTSLSAMPAHILLGETTNMGLGGNMSEYVNFEYDYQDDF